MLRLIAIIGGLALCSALAAQGPPASLLLNGGFEGRGGWARAASAILHSDRGGRCLLADREGASAIQEVAADPVARTYSCSVMVRLEDVVARPNGGCAYAAAYQLDANGQWVQFKDFVAQTGSHDWQRFDFTFELSPKAETISLRCGLYNADGRASFDDWTLVPGPRAYGFDEVGGTSQMTLAHDSIAVFRQDGFPAMGAASSPARLGQLLAGAGYTVTYLDSEDLSRRDRLHPGLYSVLVLPYGQSFPAVARQNVIEFLRGGGHFISTGGYAFNKLLLREGGQWITEAAASERRMEQALARPLLADGGFEHAADAPSGGTVLDGQWRRDGDICTLSGDSPVEGAYCAQVTVSPDNPREDRWYLDLTPRTGVTYRVSGWVRTRDVKPIGHGFAYIALYEYGADDKLGKWSDFAVVSGTQEWKQFHYDFSPAASTQRLHLKLGLYRATGTAWFDDIRLADITGAATHVMNTSNGKPGDGLEVSATQIGVFDASYPLQRVATIQPAEGQRIVPAGDMLAAPLSGWAASGVEGTDSARWVELLAAADRFGRPRGPAAALVLNYNGTFAGSMWAYFGAENRDLFDGSCPWLDRAFVRLARFMTRGMFLRNLRTDMAMYRDGEPIARSVWVENYGPVPRTCSVSFQMLPAGDASRAAGTDVREVTVQPGEAQEVISPWQPGSFDADVYQVAAELSLEGETIDQMTGGCLIERGVTARSGPELRFRDNYYQLDGRPTFLFGSDTWASVYNSAGENPWTWHLDHTAARDYGFNVYENLQTYNTPDYAFSEPEWRQFEGMAQSCQREGLVFMPCQLVGNNVAIGPGDLEKQASLCAECGKRMRGYPGLLYYLNGDFQFQVNDVDAVAALWNQWLSDRYQTLERLRTAWGEEVYGDWGKLTYPPPPVGRWDSPRECDRARFDIWLTARWVNRHVAAVRGEDTQHPITSEYYQQPYGGIDLPLTIGGQDASNIGYFDVPETDVDMLPLRLRFNDLRMRGKSLGLGEYGVKTHPAWTRENGAGGYHLVRTEEQQKQLFMAVAHYGLGLGACKVQNWCLRDSSQWIFPWGVFYPNGRMPRDAAAWHRNLSLVWRHFAPVYQPPAIAVLLPDGLRLGANAQSGVEAAYNAFRALLGLHAQFNVINEEDIAPLGADTRFLVWPSPLCPGDAAYEHVRDWVRAGGTLLVTGDMSRDAMRQRTRGQRLSELCGVEFVREITAPPTRTDDDAQAYRLGGAELRLKPAVEVRPAGARVLLADPAGAPLLLEQTLGQGKVIYCTDPLELGAADQVLDTLIALYGYALAPALPAGPDPGRDVTICRQPLAGGGEYVMAYNSSLTDARDVGLPAGRAAATVRIGPRYPAFTATDSQGALVAVGASGQASLAGQSLLSGDAQAICLSLDHRALAASSAVLVCPFSSGSLALHGARQWDDPVTVVGEVVDGAWKTYQVTPQARDLAFDADTMTCLAVVCERAEVSRWTQAVAGAMRHPEAIKGY
jgi:hypothetical protein